MRSGMVENKKDETEGAKRCLEFLELQKVLRSKCPARNEWPMWELQGLECLKGEDLIIL